MNKVSIALLILISVQVPNVYGNSLAGNAMFFDGIDDFVCIPDASHLDGMSALTIELWFMPCDTSRFNPIVTKSDGIAVMTDRSYELGLHPHTPSWSVFTGSTGWTWLYGNTSPPIQVGNWTHIAATYDSIAGIANIYFDKSLFLTTTLDAGGSPISEAVRDSLEGLVLGAVLANPYHGSYFSFGAIDDLRIWNYARNASQIADNFNSLVYPTENGLIGYWNFDESLGTQYVVDLSSYHNNGIVEGACRIQSTAPIVPEPSILAFFALGTLCLRRRKIG